jgi:hypothetical protein
VNAKDLLQNLKGQYPEAFHPSEQACKDLIRTLRGLQLSPDQMFTLYDKLIQNCEYFPKTYDVITQSSGMTSPTKGKKIDRPSVGFTVDGMRYVKMLSSPSEPYTLPEGSTDVRMCIPAEMQDYKYETWCDPEEAKQAFYEGFKNAGGKEGDPNIQAVALIPVQQAFSEYDDSPQALGIEVEYIDNQEWSDL